MMIDEIAEGCEMSQVTMATRLSGSDSFVNSFWLSLQPQVKAFKRRRVIF